MTNSRVHFPDQNIASASFGKISVRGFPEIVSNKGKSQNARVQQLPKRQFKRGEEEIIKLPQKARLHLEACG
jgi:hypothetical protein